MTVVINEMDVVAPADDPAPAPGRARADGPSAADLQRQVEQALRERRDRAQRLRAS